MSNMDFFVCFLVFFQVFTAIYVQNVCFFTKIFPISRQSTSYIHTFMHTAAVRYVDYTAVYDMRVVYGSCCESYVGIIGRMIYYTRIEIKCDTRTRSLLNHPIAKLQLLLLIAAAAAALLG